MEASSSVILAAALYVKNNVSLCMCHLAEKRTLSIDIVICFACWRERCQCVKLDEFRVEGETKYFDMCNCVCLTSSSDLQVESSAIYYRLRSEECSSRFI